MVSAKLLQYIRKFSLAGRWSLALACIPLAVTLFIALLLFILIPSDGEFFPRGFASIMFVGFVAGPVMVVTSIIGIVSGAIASIRNKCKMGMTGLALNLLVLVVILIVFLPALGISWGGFIGDFLLSTA